MNAIIWIVIAIVGLIIVLWFFPVKNFKHILYTNIF